MLITKEVSVRSLLPIDKGLGQSANLSRPLSKILFVTLPTMLGIMSFVNWHNVPSQTGPSKSYSSCGDFRLLSLTLAKLATLKERRRNVSL